VGTTVTVAQKYITVFSEYYMVHAVDAAISWIIQWPRSTVTLFEEFTDKAFVIVLSK
jgi:hypothetical protein